MKIDGNRLEFTASGLDIKNDQGEAVLQQDIGTGNLTITGTIYADGGNIGGLSILNGVLTNGDITLNMNNGAVTAKYLRATELDIDENVHPVGADSAGFLRMMPDRTFSGTASVVDGTPATVDLSYAGLTQAPIVTVCYAEPETAGVLYVDDADENGFKIYGSNTTAKAVNWIAVGR